MRIKSLFLFPNGMVVACDERGEQIPRLQGFLFDLDFREIGRHITKDTEVALAPNPHVDCLWWLERKTEEMVKKSIDAEKEVPKK